MAIPPLNRGIRWLFSETPTYDIGLALFTAIVGLSSSANYFLQGRDWLGWALALATLGALSLGVGKGIVGLRAAGKKTSLHDLEGCLYTLHAALTGGGAHDGNLRLTFHRPMNGDTEFEQLTDYIGDKPKSGRVGRKFPAKSGVIGRALLEKEPWYSFRETDDFEEGVKELVEEWDYDEWLARKLNPNVRAWMAVPFTNDRTKDVEAVMYLDSTDRGFFDSSRIQLITDAAIGIAYFIGKRYP